jgi:hypothetical protein
VNRIFSPLLTDGRLSIWAHPQHTRQLNKRRRKNIPRQESLRRFTFNHRDQSFFHSLFHWIPKMTPSQINLFATPFHINNNFNNYNDNSRVVAAAAAAAYVVSVVVAVVKIRRKVKRDKSAKLQTQPESNHVGDKTGTHKIRNV